MSNGYVTGRVDTGMEFVDVDSVELAMYYRVSELGVYIQSVAENSNAEQAGFQAGGPRGCRQRNPGGKRGRHHCGAAKRPNRSTHASLP